MTTPVFSFRKDAVLPLPPSDVGEVEDVKVDVEVEVDVDVEVEVETTNPLGLKREMTVGDDL